MWHGRKRNCFKTFLCRTIKLIQFLNSTELILQIISKSFSAMRAKTIFNWFVSYLIPCIPKDKILMPRISFRHLLGKASCRRLNVRICKAGAPTAVERAVISTAKLLAARSYSRTLILIKNVLRRTFKQKLDYHLLIILFGKLHKPVHIGEIINALSPLVPTPIYAYLKNIKAEVLHI